jgi:hypothetical protein
MKTKHKILSVLAIMAILAGLWVVVAAPASAAVVPLAIGTVNVAPSTANSVAQYTVPVTIGNGTGAGVTYVAGTDYFEVLFPEGTQMPGSFDRTSVTVAVGTTVGNPAQSPVIVAARKVRVYLPATTLSGGAFANLVTGDTAIITFTSNANIKNPTVASATKYAITVNSSQESAVTSVAYAITQSLVVTPSHGGRGTTITVSGSGFSGTLTILNINIVKFMVNPLDQDAYIAVSQTPSASDGTFTVDITATSPNFLAGSNYIVVKDGTGAMFPAPSSTMNFTLDPSIVANPTSAGAGANITITLVDFPSGDTFGAGSVTLQGIPCAVGILAGATLPVTLPLASAGLGVGSTTLTVTSNQGHTASTSFSVLGRPTQVSPATAAIGATVTLQGQSYHAGGYIKSITLAGISLFSDTTGNRSDSILVDASGNFVASVVLNGIEALQTNVGQAILVADDVSNKGGALFTIMPRAITISPTSSAIGSVVNVSGTGFRVNGYANVSYTLSGAAISALSVFATCDGSGSFATTITVPTTAAIPSTNTITAVDNVNTALTVSVSHKVPGAAITVSPTSAAIGTMVTIKGSGFAAYKTLSSLLLGIDDVRPSPTPYTDANGSFTTTVMVAGQPLGTVAVTAKVGTTTATTALTIVAAGGANTVTAGLAAIDGKYDQVWTLDAGTWEGYDPSDVANADFNTVAPGMALYIHTTEAVDNVSLGGITRDLVAGWNLIGWVS